MARKLVRVRFGGETSWGEHIEGNLYRSLNMTFFYVECKLPPDHPLADKNGQMVGLNWGHIFEGEPIEDWGVKPLFIVGYDDTPRDEG